MDLNKKIFIVKPSDNSSTSPSASFCKILAIITIIGGLIVAASSASVVNSYSSDGGFSFGVFLSSFVVYGVAGGFLFCMAYPDHQRSCYAGSFHHSKSGLPTQLLSPQKLHPNPNM